MNKMTLQSPRIYVYKITFEEVPHYYYGVHKEKKFNEKYWGSPITHKNYWELYTPKKEILKEFPYNEEGWTAAQNFENEIIKLVYNDDDLCLNEHYGGLVSLKILRENAGKGGQKSYELGVGVHGLTKEEKIKIGKEVGKKVKDLGIGVHGLSKEERIENAKKGGSVGGPRTKKLGSGVHGLSKEERIKNSKKAGERAHELGVGIHGLTTEERSKNGKLSYERGTGIHGLPKEQKVEIARKGAKAVHSQRWECTVTGHVTTPGPLTKFQRARGIDIANRIRIQ